MFVINSSLCGKAFSCILSQKEIPVILSCHVQSSLRNSEMTNVPILTNVSFSLTFEIKKKPTLFGCKHPTPDWQVAEREVLMIYVNETKFNYIIYPRLMYLLYIHHMFLYTRWRHAQRNMSLLCESSYISCLLVFKCITGYIIETFKTRRFIAACKTLLIY